MTIKKTMALALFVTLFVTMILGTMIFPVSAEGNVAENGENTYATLAEAIEDAQSGDTITVIGDISDEAVTVDKSVIIAGSTNATNVSITASGAHVELTVSGLSFTGNSWINSGNAKALTVSGVTANVNPVNTSATNSRSAFIALGNSEQNTLKLTVKDSSFIVSGGGDAILGWAAITEAHISGNTFGSEDSYIENADAAKFMSIAQGAVFTVSGNTVYSNYNGFVFGQNTTRNNAYTVAAENNDFYGSADHIWVEVSGSNTTHATVNATGSNSVNGEAFTASDIKTSVSNWTSYAGVDVVTDNEGKVIGGTLSSFSNREVLADNYIADEDGNVVLDLTNVAASIDDRYYSTVALALADAQANDTIVIHKEINDTFALTAPAVAPLTFKAATEGLKVTGRVLLPRTAVSGTVTYEGFDFSDNTNWTVYQWDGDEQLSDLELVFKNCTFGTKGICIGFDYNKENWNLKKLTLDSCTASDATEVFSLQYVNEVVIQNCDFSNATDRLINVSAASGNVTVSQCNFGDGAIQLSQNVGSAERNLTVENSTFTGEKAVVIHENLTNAATQFGTIELVDNTVDEATEIVNFKNESVEADVYLENNYVTFNGNKTEAGTEVEAFSNGYEVVEGRVEAVFWLNRIEASHNMTEGDLTAQALLITFKNVPYIDNNMTVKLYHDDELLSTTNATAKRLGQAYDALTTNVIYSGDAAISGSWTTEINAPWTINRQPNIVVVDIDGEETIFSNFEIAAFTNFEQFDLSSADISGAYVYNPDNGQPDTDGYRENLQVDLTDVYANTSLVIKTYSGDTLLATTSLKAVDDENTALFPVNASSYSCNIVLKGKPAGSWTTQWHITPNADLVPDKFEAYADGILVDTYEGLGGIDTVGNNVGGAVAYSELSALADWNLVFDTNGGSEIMTLMLDEDTEIDLQEYVPARAGYRFYGWYEDEELTVPVTTTTLSSDTTVYAKWKKTSNPSSNVTKYTLSFQTNGGTEVASVRKVRNTTVDLSKYITRRDGYSFDGWYTDEDEKVTEIKMVENTVLYAKWVEGDNGYTDNPNYKPDIMSGEHHAYIVGSDGGYVYPENMLTRAEAATIFFRLLNDEVRSEAMTRQNGFSDVSEKDWFNTAISTLVNLEILKGRTADTFAPNEPITRAEFTAIVARLSEASYTGDDLFNDISGHWAQEYINIAASINWVNGEDGLFRPDDNITRAEVMTLVNRALNRLPETEDDLTGDMFTALDNTDTGSWYYLAVQEATNSHDYETDGKHEKWTALTENPDWAELEK